MPKQAKRIQAWTGDRLAAHSVEDAIKLVKENAKA
ncbi:MAG: 50S ribosomal protein L1, partial [Phenylobacterium sp.]|nr:50S ribosomal protein L1 [Phenylobacterium sp.]